MKILFICKFNRFRSKSAEALFNKYNKNKSIEVKSAGITKSNVGPYVPETVVKELAQMGAKANKEPAQIVNEEMIKWADKIILAADNVPIVLFPKEKTEKWLIEDVSSEFDIKGIKKSLVDIEEHIKVFVKSLDKTNL